MSEDGVTKSGVRHAAEHREQAVKQFEPYAEVREELPEARAALHELLTPAKPGRPNTRFIYVNNRLEGSAPRTIYSVLTELSEN
jgi:hypothetical protein